MKSFLAKAKIENHIKWLLIAAIVFLTVLRFVSLDIDPPYFFAGITQAHLTDPYHITLHARSAVLFGEWTPFDYHRWDVFKNSIVSGTAYVVFSLFGVSRVTANLAGLILNSLGLLFMFLGIARHRPSHETLLGAFLATLSAMLMFYGRLPFLENGLIFWAGLTFFLFARYYDRPGVQFIIGFLIALAAFSGKLFGFILIVPVLMSYFYIYRNRVVTPALRTIIGAIAGSIIFVAVFYGGDYQNMLSYYHEQTTGMYGTPTGFKSLYNFLMNLLTYGGESGFFRLSPFLIILAGLGSILCLTGHREYEKFRSENIPVVFMVSWLLIGMLLLSPFTYRPLRYTLFLFMPLSAVCAWTIGTVLSGKLSNTSGKLLLTAPISFVIILYLAIQLKMTTVPGNQALVTAGGFLFPGVLMAMAVTAALLILLVRSSDSLKTLIMAVVVLALMLAAVIFQGRLIYRGLSEPGTYLRDIGREIEQMVGPAAVLTGPYAPALTIDNNLKAVIYVFGLPDVERELFEKYPITHLAADYSNHQAAVKIYPFLNDAVKLDRFLIRDGTVDLYRIPGAKTPLTDYERFISDYDKEIYDSVLYYNERFCTTYPQNLSGQFNLVINYISFGQNDKAIKGLQTLAELYPDNFRVASFEYQCYRFLADQLKKPDYNITAESFFKRSLEINPTAKRTR